MHVVAYQHWAKKPQNKPPRGLTAEDASDEFKKKAQDPEVHTDEDGPYNNPSEDFRLRIGVQVSTTITERNMHQKRQGSRAHVTLV